MATLRITIDGNTVLDGDVDQWTDEPPAIADLKLKVGREPWAIPAMHAIVHAVTTQRDTAVTVATTESTWTLQVAQT